MITLDSVDYRLGERVLLKGVELHLEHGDFVVLVGPSGAGKTTLLRLIAGLVGPSRGRVLIDDRLAADSTNTTLLPPGRRQIGFVFQDLALWPHMRVEAHLDWPLRLARVGAPQRAARVRELLAMVQLDHRRHAYPETLSGGEQQRLALARALAGSPKILLLDEPFASLDPPLRTELRQVLRQVHRECGTTSLLVTHDQQEAVAVADRIVVMQAGELVQSGPAEQLLQRPATAFVAGFFGSPPGCLLPARRAGGVYRCLGQPLQLDLPPGYAADLKVYYRPQRLSLDAADSGGFPVTVTEVLPLGGQWHYRLQAAGQALDLIGATRIDPARGDLYLRLPQRPDAVFQHERLLPRKKLVLVRHGMSDWNRDGRLQGRADRPLAAPATAQIQALQERLDWRAFARVETSPLRRARHSAELLVGDSSVIRQVPGWCEIDVGSWEGRPISELEPDAYRAWRAGSYTPDGGEPWAQFCARIGRELERLRMLEGDTLVICHGGVIRACLQLLLQHPLDKLPPSDYAGVHTIWLEPVLAADTSL
ncbi:ATP-binding cassette domain-containing protein [Exilibacterium tricleocarpae]|uniref:ATP-binding cassette domain-containing protein n=1 Tax=Exilibacterium tricleocarpae TaxID=2591008 RepID=A0A545TAP8_9GAMM|nr:histidine phosphatase family protein [Exilibacterium tricleocarpae]TQV74264.1 ATP-binding cassette domain-containing protein [Exilibacterium tricleocarpae]